MLEIILRRLLWMIPTLLAISFISFVVIQLPPGDFLTSYIAAIEAQGEMADQREVERLRRQYALDEPFLVQYAQWLARLLPVGWVIGDEAFVLQRVGHPILKVPDMGMSFEYERPVHELIGERILLTMVISVATLLFTWAVAIPIGIYSAVNKYSPADHAFTFLGFIGLAVPNFILALIFMYISYAVFGVSAGGLVAPEMRGEPWHWEKIVDFLSRLWVPVVIIGTAGTAGLIRVMRANLLDELGKQYVITAHAKGVPPVQLLFRYPVRVALNPVISTIGWVLPMIISGEAITSIVLGLPTTGELLLNALLSQDMYLAGSMVMLLSALTVVGTLISDLLLILLDPRIRYEGKSR